VIGAYSADMGSLESPNDLHGESAEMSYTPSAGAAPTGQPRAPSGIVAVKQRNEARLLAVDGVEGVAVGRDPIGRDAVLVFVRDRSVVSRLPREIEGFPVVVEATGVIDAL